MAVRWAPALVAGLIASQHLGRPGEGILVGCAVLAAAWILDPRGYPTHLMPIAGLAIGAAIPVVGVVIVYAVSLATTPMALSHLVAPVLGAWVVLALATWTLARSVRGLEARVAVVGPPALAAALARELHATGITSYRVVGWIDRREGRDRRHSSLELASEERRAGRERRSPIYADPSRLGLISEVERIVSREGIDLIVNGAEGPAAADGPGASPLEVLTHVADTCLGLGVRMIGLNQLYEDLFGHLPLTTMNTAFFQYLMHPRFRYASPAAKRGFDLIVAGSLSLLTLPLVVAVAVSRGLSGRGPAFTSGTYVGARGEEFTLRRLRVNGFLGRLGAAEVPRLWSVVSGRMSLVGPRPERPETLALLELQVPFYDRRELIKPGLTGWAQVRSGPAGTEAAWRLSHDLYYLKHRSAALDLMILVETLVAGLKPLELRTRSTPERVAVGAASAADRAGAPRRLAV